MNRPERFDPRLILRDAAISRRGSVLAGPRFDLSLHCFSLHREQHDQEKLVGPAFPRLGEGTQRLFLFPITKSEAKRFKVPHLSSVDLLMGEEGNATTETCRGGVKKKPSLDNRHQKRCMNAGLLQDFIKSGLFNEKSPEH